MGKVNIKDYDKEWENMYEKEEILISDILGEKVESIEHIGSTSIPGMCSKPLIDIAISVENFDNLEQIIKELDSIGYEYVPKENYPERKFFRRGEWGAGTHHIHLYLKSSEDLKNMLLFRNYLKKHQEVANEYKELKKLLSSEYERETYTKKKAPFIQKVINKAREEFED